MPLPAWLNPVYDAAQMGEADRWAIEQRSIPSLELMETAGAALAHAAGGIARPGPVRIVCGKGNNGGDGLVAARHLHAAGYEVEVLLLWPEEQLSGDAEVNLDRYEGPRRRIEGGRLERAIEGSGLIIDAVFGTGFDGSPRSPIDEGIAAINACDAPVCACDIPSGVNGSNGEVAGEAVAAELTVTFHAAKVGHLVAPGKWACGEVQVVDVGIPADAPVEVDHGAIDLSALELAPARGPGSTKFSSGNVLVAGGSRGLTGAPCMVAEAASRGGAGYVTLAVPRSLETIFEVKLTEQMTIGVPGRDGALDAAAADEIVEAAERADAVVVGPGMGRSEHSFELARELFSRLEAPLVIDADGLNALAGDLDPVIAREQPAVLTPHAGELARLLGVDSAEVAARRLTALRDLVERTGAIVVLKGDDTLIGGGEGGTVAINEFGAPALATAGTGDVLAGLIAALIARGIDPFAAACTGVLAHARAGRVAARTVGSADLVTASDVIAALPEGLSLREGPSA